MWNTVLMWIIGIVWYGILGLCGVIVVYEVGAMFKLWPSRLQPDPIPSRLPVSETEELSA
jgi:hypothetical protein